jgi:chorismate dehydratase
MNRLRVGHIQYINTYPLFYTILKERETLPFDLVSDTPARLNEMMREGNLDVSLISSFEYAATPERYLIYRDYCLASTGYLNSVLLVSKREIEELQGATIGLSDSSATSTNLIKILLKEFYGLTTTFNTISYQEDFEASLTKNDAILIIGDEALKFVDNGKYRVYDVSHLWTEKTGCPVVFAIIAINIQSSKMHKKELELLFEKLKESQLIFKERPEEIIEFAKSHSPLSINFLNYFSNLTYTFTDEFKEGLRYYYGMLEKCGLIPKAEKLRFY